MSVERESDGRWKPGVSGNPSGRPKKGQTITDALQKYLEERESTEDDALTRKERLIQTAYELATVAGDITALRYIIDRIDGKPGESVKISGDIDEPVQLIIGSRWIPGHKEIEDDTETEDANEE